jgi:lysophospholipase L1-like esterase
MPPLKPIKKAGLVLFGILVAVTIGEGFLTWIDYSYTPLRIKTIENYTEWRFRLAFENKDFVYDSYLIWRPRKGVPPFNSQSYSGDEITATKNPGSFRIFAIGDSNTLGWLGEKDYNWPKYLQNILREQDSRFEVINAGVYGYSSFQGFRRFQEALSFQPDMVLISFGLNDALQVTVSDAKFDSRTIQKLKLDKILLRLKVGQLILALSDSIFSGGNEGLVPRVSLAEYEANLNEIIQLAKERNIKVLLLTRPTTEESPSAYDSVTVRVAKSTGIPVIDVYALFRGRREYFYDTNHFNEEGHRLMAKIMYQHIKGLL